MLRGKVAIMGYLDFSLIFSLFTVHSTMTIDFCFSNNKIIKLYIILKPEFILLNDLIEFYQMLVSKRL